MQKIIIISIISLFYPFAAFCQLQIDWQQCYGGSVGDYAHSIVKDGNGYKIIGYTGSNDGDISYNHGGGDYWVVKIDSIGNLLSEKTYGGSSGEHCMSGFNEHESTNIYLAGGSGSTDGDISYNPYPEPESTNFWFVKIDNDDNIIWDRMVGCICGQYFYSASPTSDGGLVAIGAVTPGGGDVSNHYGAYDSWVIKLDSDGNTDWDFTIGTSWFDYGNTIIQTSDGGYLAGGNSRVEDGGNITCEPFSYKAEAILFKLDADGNEEWQQCYGGSEDDFALGLLELDDGYIIVAMGQSNDGDLEGSGWHGESDIWLIRIDLMGKIIWQKCYGGSANENAHNIFQTSDGGFMVFGNTDSSNGDVVGNPSLGNESSIWIFKVDSLGELIWQQCIGGSRTERVYGVMQKSDYDYVIAGEMFYSPSGDVNCSNFVYGSQQNYWVFELSDTTVSIADNFKKNINIYPNPAKSVLNIDFPNEYNIQNTTIKIIDLHGKTILQSTPFSNSTRLNIKKLNSGLYLVKIQNKNTIITKRIIIQ